MIKHTKGPWEVKRSESKQALNIVGTVLAGKYKIASCPIIHSPNQEPTEEELDQVQANAKLIAAAPLMLETLMEAKEVLSQLDTRHNGNCYNPGNIGECDCTLCKIDKTIKKATE